MPGTTLDELTRRYLVPGTAQSPTFTEDTEWVPVIDGIDYFAQVSALLDRAGPGDSFFATGLQIESDMDLTGRAPGDEGYRPLTDLLAEKASAGVDVRILLTAAVFSGSVPGVKIGPFRANVFAALAFREHASLRGRVLLDWSGAGIGCHHQKMVVLHVGGELTAFVGGLDLSANRYDAEPHDRLSIGEERWGWHDGAVRLRGPAAARVWEVYRGRWLEAASLPSRDVWFPPARWEQMNPEPYLHDLPPAPDVPAYPSPGTSVQVLRSFRPWKIDQWFALYRRHWTVMPKHGVREVFHALAAAIRGAQHYIYLEDQYFYEAPGGRRAFRLYGLLRDAAARGVKVVLVCSGRKDPADGGVNKFRRRVTGDIQRGVIDQLDPADRGNVMMHRIEDLTVHTKLMLVDDVFAGVGSANFFSRSMRGTDSELSTVMVTTGDHVRELRVRLWAEHLRTPLTDELRPALEDIDLAIGIWHPHWLPPDSPAGSWRRPGYPAGFAPAERVLVPVGPWPEPSPRPLRRAADGAKKGAKAGVRKIQAGTNRSKPQ
ncbi:phosphatidylserine/phosphatidylglycerophosphate/cardiolipin synthase-like enzyme [Pseudonocardia sediminis]|uniref:Phosphatidylserine/phosphatidylglycerophosphate/ cardiolipin synthase-like enzyme n=1 Tax=Pseudonocardia sediminis TaxID=1397368 RepID=A0A4Q7V711_PSEST|nr:phospholipase D-like domain-containing protein [Pseudonocardia sediminis]RZT88583.1 phosphatidylserine/phosphatidylglycerophosphate/cardiolipin synthase-like enzyme [Pseudonocardia sediminis]